MSRTDQVVSVVAPLHNDAACLEAFVGETLAVLPGQFRIFELILVDDGSTDATAAIAERLARTQPGVRLIRLSRRFGNDVAVIAGLESSVGDVVVVMRPDVDPPADIGALVRLANEGADVVQGLATNSPRESWLFRLGQAIFTGICTRLFRLEIPPTTSSLRAFSRRAVNAITRIKQKQRHLSLLSCCVGFDRRTYAYRKVFRGGPPPRQGLLAAVDLGITLLVMNSRSPLRFVSYLGALAGLLNLLYVVYVLAVNLLRDHVMEGWTTLSLQNSLMFFFVFLILVLMAEYVSWILEEAKDQPLYHILDEIGTSRIAADGELRNVITHDYANARSSDGEQPHAA
jgi:glycosyltransferase involved in cell wall biosynthesis